MKLSKKIGTIRNKNDLNHNFVFINFQVFNLNINLSSLLHLIHGFGLDCKFATKKHLKQENIGFETLIPRIKLLL